MVFYSPVPTHNSDVGVPCPEKREDLRQLADKASNKIEWHDVVVYGEGNHRREIFKYTAGYDLVLNADSDEVWDQWHLEKCLNEAINIDSRNIGVYGFVNFYRSFNWTVHDFFYPIRIHNLKSQNPEVKTVDGRVYHFGYAQREEMVRYKILIHGHRGEWKHNWLQNKFLNFNPETTKNMHPCSEDVWLQADWYDKTALPDMLKSHPYYDKDII
jgi:hypothetical protein